MSRLSINERTKIVEFWHQSKSVKRVQHLFCGHFGVHMQYSEVLKILAIKVRNRLLKSRDESIFDKRKVENNAIDYRLPIDTKVLPRSVLKVIMWVTLGCFGIIAPYCFEDDHGAYLNVELEELMPNDTKLLFPKLRV